MHKRTAITLLIILLVLIFLLRATGSSHIFTGETVSVAAYTPSSDITMKRDLLALMLAYPEFVTGVEKNNNGLIYAVMVSGEKVIYDDMTTKSFEEKLANADLQDMMDQAYPLSDINTVMADGLDPGRIRSYILLREVYGNARGEIEDNLINVSLGGSLFPFNRNNAAASALEEAFAELSGLTVSEPNIYGFVYPVNGTFNYRNIAGTGLLSPHSFGIAIDLKSNSYDYWRWATKAQGQERLSRYPMSLVRVFENHGFIWGGKWEHFDFLHYEYRPELILKARCDATATDAAHCWYDGFPDTELTKSCVNIIERALG